jgi:hypothetical protein
MLFVKNLPVWERTLRVLVGVGIIGYGIYRYHGAFMQFPFMGAGVIAALTGFFGFCPACWLLGRKLKSEN